MKADHGRRFSLALFVGRCLCALALAYVSLNAAAVPINKGTIGKLGAQQNGRATSLTPGGAPVNSGGSTIPVSPSIGGWTTAGNYGVPTGATGPTAGININGKFVVGGSGVNYPVGGAYSVPWGLVAPAAAGVICAVATAGVCGVAGAAAAASPYIMDWIGKAGLSRNPTSGNIEKPEIDSSWPVSDGYLWRAFVTSGTYKDTRQEACQLAATEYSANNATYLYTYSGFTTTGGSNNLGQCLARESRRDNGQQGSNYYIAQLSKGVPSGCPLNWYKTPAGCVSASNLPRIAINGEQLATALGGVNPDPRVWGEVLEKGGTIDMPNPTVTGPTSIQGPEKSTSNPDGSRTVERTTHNFTTNNNTVTNTTNVTTTTVYNSDNSVRSTSTTTTTPTTETPDPGDPCEKRPETVGCAEFDTPEGKIPRDTKEITYAEENTFGGGSCPADVMWSPQSVSGTYKFINWQQACGWAASLKWLVILLGTWAAFWIVMPGNTQAKPQ